MKATGYVGEAFPAMTFRLQVALFPITVDTSFFTIAPESLQLLLSGQPFLRKHCKYVF